MQFKLSHLHVSFLVLREITRKEVSLYEMLSRITRFTCISLYTFVYICTSVSYLRLLGSNLDREILTFVIPFLDAT